MKLARFVLPGGRAAVGVVGDDALCLVEGDVFGKWRQTESRFPLAGVRLLPPVTPPNILCIGRNYRAHATEGGGSVPAAPLLFLKAVSCLSGPGDPIVIPRVAPDCVDFEAELAVVIGRPARGVSPAEALNYVLGYTCANDVSAGLPERRRPVVKGQVAGQLRAAGPVDRDGV